MEDSELRWLFGELRAADRATTPPIEALLRRRRRAPWAVAAVAAALVLLAVVLWPERPAETVSLNEWRSPTAALLEAPAGPPLGGLPPIGQIDEEVFQCEGCF